MEDLVMPSVRWQLVARFGFPGLLAGLCLAWFLGSGRQPVVGAEAPPVHESGGTIAFTSASAGNSQWLYLIDTRSQTFAVYRVDSQNAKGTVKLEAARHYRWDMKLAEYNNQPPEVAAVESMVRTTK
jgi:hypothetical protein